MFRSVRSEEEARPRWESSSCFLTGGPDPSLLKETPRSVSHRRRRRAAQIKRNIKGPEMKAPKVERCQASERALHIPIFPIDRRAAGSFADRPADKRRQS